MPEGGHPAGIGYPELAGGPEWTACSQRGGDSFPTHELKAPEGDRVAFRPTVGSVGSRLAVLAVAVGLVVACPMPADATSTLLLGLVGVVLALVGAWHTWYALRPIVFDRKLGRFWVGWLPPEAGWSPPRRCLTCVELRRVHALQIVPAPGEGEEKYELNLVRHDGIRVNVVTHGDLARIRLDAAALGVFLGVPVWDPPRL